MKSFAAAFLVAAASAQGSSIFGFDMPVIEDKMPDPEIVKMASMHETVLQGIVDTACNEVENWKDFEGKMMKMEKEMNDDMMGMWGSDSDSDSD